MDWIDTLWTAAMWVLLGTAAAVVAWSVLGDWWRGKRAVKRAITQGGERRRCGTCWYDMRGVAGLVCPECGREARNERGLQRSRVRWRGVLVGLVVLVPAWVAAKMPEVRVGGWGRLVPTAVLACWPMDVGAWVDGSPVDWAGKELESRRAQELPGWFGARMLAWRLSQQWRKSVFEDGRDFEVAVLDTGGVAANWLGVHEGPMSPMCGTVVPMMETRKDYWVFIHATTPELRRAIAGVVSPTAWEENGGDEGRMCDIGDRIVVACPAERLAEIRELLAVMETPAAHEESAEWRDVTVFGSRFVGPPYDTARVSDLRYLLQNLASNDQWTQAGGDSASFLQVDGMLLIQGPVAIRARCMEVLAAINDCTLERRHVERVDLSLVCVDPGLLVPERSGWGWVTDTGIRNLRALIMRTVRPDGWEDNGGDEAAIHVFDDRLVIRGPAATRARSVAVLEALVACSEMSRRVETADVTVHCLDRLPGSMKNEEGKRVVKEDEVIHLRNLLSNIVDSEAWVENGGDHGLTNTHGPMLVVSGDARMRNRSAVVIEAILSTQHDQVARRCGGSPCTDVNGQAATEHVAVWPLRQMLGAWGALSPSEFDAWVAEDPAARDPRKALERLQREGRSGEVRTRGSSEREAGRAILDRLCAGKTDSWHESSRLSVFHDVLVLWTLDPGVVQMVEEALPAMKSGPGANRAD